IVPGTSGYCRPVEFIDLTIVFGHEPPVNGRWIRLPLLDPEERPLAIAKSPQIRMITFARVGQKELDNKRLQGRLIERQRTFDIADSQNHVVEHCSPSNHKCFDGLFTIRGRQWVGLSNWRRPLCKGLPINRPYFISDAPPLPGLVAVARTPARAPLPTHPRLRPRLPPQARRNSRECASTLPLDDCQKSA